MAPRKIKTTKRRQVYRPYKVAKTQRENCGEDRISQLPEDILVAILSHLTLQEAGRTSVLSHKWRYLWTVYTGSFNFDTWDSYLDLTCGIPITSSTYVSRVNKFVELHQGQSVEEFRIRFSLDASNSRDIDSWVDFAFEKGVKRFELDLTRLVPKIFNLTRMPPCPTRTYDFPRVEKFWLSSNSLQGLQSNGHVTQTAGSLTSLRLVDVNVSAEVIEQFLGNCPFLEQLQVVRSECLGNLLKVDGPSLKLKFLEISKCFRLRVLEISAINLVSLTYKGPFISLLLKNVPALSELCTWGGYCTSLIYKSHQHLSYLHQLQSLKLDLPEEFVERSMKLPHNFPKLCTLKKLELEFMEELGERLIAYTSFLEACPLLSRFTMRYSLQSRIRYSMPRPILREKQLSSVEHNKVRDARRAAARSQHQCLKVVELVGFCGGEDELELASHLLGIAVSLDELVINPRPLFSFDHPRAFVRTESLERARQCARQLEKNLPPKATLVVL